VNGNPAEIKVDAITQVGIVVRDVDKVVENYWNILGIGPWKVHTYPPPHIRNRRYHGKPVYFVVKAAHAQVGAVELELMQTIEGHTVYDDFLAAHGEGVHHVQYRVSSAEEVYRHIDLMTEKGFPSLQDGYFGDNGAWSYFDTESALGVSWEPVHEADNFYGPVVRYPVNEEETSPARIKIKAIDQISLSVKNLEVTMENYWNIFGIGPWEVFECVPPGWQELTYYGKPARHTARAGLAMVGPVELELVQPVSGDTVYRDHICKHGDGVNHIAFRLDKVNDVYETKRVFEEDGFPCIQFGNVCDDGPYAYFDTRGPLKVIWEVFRPPTSYPDTSSYPK
jgi:4-hydroxyphenylpyruvate dioxygenase-like putative hemolysin